jgi:hypothetical protein
MSAFTSAAQGDSCRTTKKFLQSSKKTFHFLMQCKQSIRNSALAKRYIKCHNKHSTVSSASWPSGSPGTIYDNTPIPCGSWAPGCSP